MKNFIFALGGLCAAAAGWLVWGKRMRELRDFSRTEELAHTLQDAWADHHTVA